MENDKQAELATTIVAAYVSQNSLPAAEVPAFLNSIHSSIACLGQPQQMAQTEVAKATAAQIKKSISPEALISFIDGKPYKTLRRHLNSAGLTAETYRARYGLPPDYPMVSPNYSAQRSALARALGLGQRGPNMGAASSGGATVTEAQAAPAKARPSRARKPDQAGASSTPPRSRAKSPAVQAAE